MLPIQARFSSQEQAESVIRKLASLRSETFRLERVGSNGTADGASSMELSPAGISLSSSVVSDPTYSSSEEFTLSASVPGAVADQARNVIIQAGGQVI